MTITPAIHHVTAFGTQPQRGGLRQAVFLDRDGVLIRDKHYLSEVAGIEILPGVIGALRALAPHFRLIMVTNQSGVARALFTVARLAQIHDALLAQFARQDVHLDALYCCPHHRDGTLAPYAIACACRKPQPGMLLHAIEKWELDPARCFMLGDQESDMLAGHGAGVRSLMIGPDGAGKHAHPLYPDLGQAARHMLAHAR
ncbi:D-glycero-alpha-D-manno-heptose-1,7-bisphosphate 7-phosphatase [Massilia pseudoviolaceinigra]|uniref:D-glycero-alpha-D-manno-heptose-1,7-bisphosphate 7-phosphatase n=1 Tax=Massilia pseudoviolaceinigra TaxID=3057165 RepID=UPI0027968018|nr:HAD family hydrolase [Massilia sp. CCM 9206]MDQ1923594.1 HAD family hydrolase [Massilia sp. CCM 9206]